MMDSTMPLQRFTNFLFSVLLGCLLIGKVELYYHPDVVLEVLLTRFSNPLNRNALNECCDGKKDASMCTDTCDIFFSVCPPTQNFRCNTSKVVFWNSSEFMSSGNFTTSSGTRNFLSLIYRKEYSQFSISFYDNDSSDRSPNLTNVSSHEAVINFTQALPSTVQPIVHRRIFSKNNISFEILYRLKCSKEHYYGGRCKIRCLGKDGPYSHFKCLENGTRVCISGWKGKLCNYPICANGCGENGWCKKPNFCECFQGWTGQSCTECIPDRKCLHGTCTKHSECKCEAGWTGTYCNVLRKYCSHYHPCKKGTCQNTMNNFTCECQPGWSGKKCDKALCSPLCNLTNAECTTNGNCSCKPGWRGVNCNRCIPSGNCTHGYCNQPFECLCHEDWSGEKCNEPKSCTQWNPCQNNGRCNDSARGDYICNCKRGFTGKHCESEVVEKCPMWCTKGHGYCEDNECRCHDGWQGPNCTECVLNSSCVNGYCRQPFECVCNKNWTGPFCNITIHECAPENNRSHCPTSEPRKHEKSSSDTDWLIYIVASLSSVLIVMFLACLVQRLHRKRLAYDVSHSHAIENNVGRPSYTLSSNNPKENGWNNNILYEADIGKYVSSEIVLNPITLQPSKNSRSMLISNEIYESNDVICNEDSISPDSAEYCVI